MAIRACTCRFHPRESRWFERRTGLTWCPECRIYSADIGTCSRDKILTDALACLPADEQERLRRSDHTMVAHLDAHDLAGKLPGAETRKPPTGHRVRTSLFCADLTIRPDGCMAA
jgi:hypothetical protein